MDVPGLFTLLLVSWIWFVSSLGAPGNRTRGVGRIVGGVAADIVDFPHQVSLQEITEAGYDHYCGGSIISNSYILTAAHCVVGRNRSTVRVVAGITLLNDTGSEAGFANITIHHRYKNNRNDIALIELDTPLNFSNKIQSIDLANTCKEIPQGTAVVGTGWGETRLGGGLSDSLQEVTLQISNKRACKNIYKAQGVQIKGHMICAKAPGRDTCRGDSGGPLIKEGLPNTLQGITSGGIGCAHPDFPGVYTRVCKFKNWINTTTGGVV